MTVVGTSDLVAAAVARAAARVLPPALAGADPLVRRSEHADFQSNVALALAGKAGTPPRELAESIRRALDGFPATVSGPGFLNLTVPDGLLWSRVAQRLADRRLGVGTPLAGSRVVIDYSHPNIAKEMHVGHLRTTVIGDALARVLGYLGAEVIRQNHLGDWGTQFGMLIQYLEEHPEADLSALNDLYPLARAAFDAGPGFADRARARVVALQSGDEATLAVWRDLVAVSQRAFQAVYDRLGVLLGPEDVAGESSYNPYLDEIAAELADKGIAVDSGGALCVFFDEFTGPDGEPVPLIVRKSDGGYGYAATDLATVRYRVRQLQADRILYVIDARQALHLKMVFATARRAGWLTGDVEATHVAFGSVLGPDGKPFKTRAGGTVRLTTLLDEAEDRARALMAQRRPDLDPATLDGVVRAGGIGSVKYADLSTSRTKDYVFDLDRMVSLSGNTAVYLQYAHARVRSILGRLPDGEVPSADPALPLHPAERALALTLDAFAATVGEVAEALEPHRLCAYLFELAQVFSGFFEACPVLRAEPARRGNRVALVRLTGETLATGLDLLGLQAPHRI